MRDFPLPRRFELGRRLPRVELRDTARAISQENVEVIRRLLPGPDVDIAQAVRDDDMWLIWVPSHATHVGVEGLREAWLDS
jgi:hypothetical protein